MYPGVDIQYRGRKVESDIVWVSEDRDHKAQIVIGECKRRMEISSGDVDNLIEVANKFEAKGIRCLILFSKLADFSPHEIEDIKKVNDGYGLRAIIMGTEELEPWRIRWQSDDRVRPYEPHNLDELAGYTSEKYLDGYPFG